MKFPGQFSGRISFDAFWAYEPETMNPLPEPLQPAARWCSRCWKLIPNGERAYDYLGSVTWSYRIDICHPCHKAIFKESTCPPQESADTTR